MNRTHSHTGTQEEPSATQKEFQELDLTNSRFDSTFVEGVNPDGVSEKASRVDNPGIYVLAFIQALLATAVDPEKETLTAWVATITGAPVAIFSRTLAQLEVSYAQCTDAYEALKQWMKAAKKTRQEINRLEHQKHVLEQQVSNNILPAKARPPTEFTKLLERATAFQQKSVTDASQLLSARWKSLVTDMIKTEVASKKEAADSYSSPSFVAAVDTIHASFAKEMQDKTLSAEHLVFTLAKWGIPMLLKRREQYNVEEISKAAKKASKARELAQNDTDVEMIDAPPVTGDKDDTANLTAIVLSLKEQVESLSKKNSNKPSPKPSLKPHTGKQDKGRNSVKKGGVTKPQQPKGITKKPAGMREPHTDSKRQAGGKKVCNSLSQKKRNQRTRTHYKVRASTRLLLNSSNIPKVSRENASLDDVHVLSNAVINPMALSGLSLGSGFIPTTESQFAPATKEINTAILDFGRRVIQSAYMTDSSRPPFYPPAQVNDKLPSGKLSHIGYRICRMQLKIAGELLQSLAFSQLNSMPETPSNIPLPVRKAMNTLLKDDTHTVANADKNMGITVVPTWWYVLKCEQALLKVRPNGVCDYIRIDRTESDINKDIATELKSKLDCVAVKNGLTEVFEGHANTVRKYMHPQTTLCKLATWYALIKVHKTPIKVRCISACTHFITSPAAKVTAKILHPITVKMFPQVLKDTKDFISRIDAVTIKPEHREHVVFCAADIEGLYPNIPIETAVEKINEGLTQAMRENVVTPKVKILVLILTQLVFFNMFVKFNKVHYKQLHGFPMGSALSPEAANFFMGVIESFCGRFKCPAFDKIAQSYNIECYSKGRYIDDYFFILAGDTDNTLKQAEALLHKFADILMGRAGLNLELTISTEHMDFLDVHVYKPVDFTSHGKFAYRTHQKANNKYQYLHRKSMHPNHVFKAIIKGELTRYCITNSTEEWYNTLARRFAVRLLCRGYSYKEFQDVYKTLNYKDVRTALFGDKPPHSIEVKDTDDKVTRFIKLQYNSSTKLLNCKPVVQMAVDKMHQQVTEYGTSNDKRALDTFSRLDIQVCHKRAKSLGSTFKRVDTT